MTVDTRYQPRVDLGIEVQIVHRSRSIRALSQNLSRGGIFLNTTAIKIPTGTFVGLEFAIDDTTWQIDGLVVRQDKAGIGAIFRVPQPELFKIAANYKRLLRASLLTNCRQPQKSLMRLAGKLLRQAQTLIINGSPDRRTAYLLAIPGRVAETAEWMPNFTLFARSMPLPARHFQSESNHSQHLLPKP